MLSGSDKHETGQRQGPSWVPLSMPLLRNYEQLAAVHQLSAEGREAPLCIVTAGVACKLRENQAYQKSLSQLHRNQGNNYKLPQWSTIGCPASRTGSIAASYRRPLPFLPLPPGGLAGALGLASGSSAS